MPAFISVLFLAAGLGLLVLMRVWLRRQQASPAAQAGFSVAVLLGALLGIGASLRLELQLGPTTRVVGAPLPLVVHRLEAGQWVEYPPPREVMAILAAANAAIVAATLAGPACLVLGWLRSREKGSRRPDGP